MGETPPGVVIGEHVEGDGVVDTLSVDTLRVDALRRASGGSRSVASAAARCRPHPCAPRDGGADDGLCGGLVSERECPIDARVPREHQADRRLEAAAREHVADARTKKKRKYIITF